MKQQAWWLVDGDTRQSRKFSDLKQAIDAALRAHDAHTAKGFDARDKYYLISGGEKISMSALLEGRDSATD